MASKLTEVAIDCADPHGLARFWCDVLDYEVRAVEGEVVTIGADGNPETVVPGLFAVGEAACVSVHGANR